MKTTKIQIRLLDELGNEMEEFIGSIKDFTDDLPTAKKVFQEATLAATDAIHQEG